MGETRRKWEVGRESDRSNDDGGGQSMKEQSAWQSKLNKKKFAHLLTHLLGPLSQKVQYMHVEYCVAYKPDVGTIEFYNQRLYVVICYTLDVSVAYLNTYTAVQANQFSA